MTAVVYAPDSVVHELGQQIVDLIGVPKDQWEIAAQLEVMGLSDGDARNDYGARDLFDLARRIYGWFEEGRSIDRSQGGLTAKRASRKSTKARTRGGTKRRCGMTA